jgi:hypothetical protein
MYDSEHKSFCPIPDNLRHYPNSQKRRCGLCVAGCGLLAVDADDLDNRMAQSGAQFAAALAQFRFVTLLRVAAGTVSVTL